MNSPRVKLLFDIDGTRELNYHFVAQTIAGGGLTGYIAHEYKLNPRRDGV